MTSTEVTLTTDGRSIAEMMGLSKNSSGKRSMLARFSQIHSPLKGDMEINGKADSSRRSTSRCIQTLTVRR
jgi:ABC-type proline/glycine betaine transport system ATPase subunit